MSAAKYLTRGGSVIATLVCALAACSEVVSGQRDPAVCLSKTGYEQATCFMESAEFERGWDMMLELARGGDPHARALVAEQLRSSDLTLIAEAKIYALELARQGDTYFLQELIEQAESEHSSDDIRVLRCAMRPDLSAANLKFAYETGSRDDNHRSLLNRVLTLALSGEPTRTAPSSDRQIAEIRAELQSEAPWLELDESLLASCEE